MLSLQPVNSPKGDSNRFCGPAVISALTGMTTGAAARLIRQVSPTRKCVMGTYSGEMLRALRLCGIDGKSSPRMLPNPTLAGWLKATHGQRGGRTFLIAAGHHWQIVQGNRYVCGLSKAIVGLTHDVVSRRARVTEVYELTATGAVAAPVSVKAKPVDRNRKLRDDAKRLAAQYGVLIEPEQGFDRRAWFVHHPDLMDTGNDPCEGDHYSFDWDDVMARVRDYEAYFLHLRKAA